MDVWQQYGSIRWAEAPPQLQNNGNGLWKRTLQVKFSDGKRQLVYVPRGETCESAIDRAADRWKAKQEWLKNQPLPDALEPRRRTETTVYRATEGYQMEGATVKLHRAYQNKLVAWVQPDVGPGFSMIQPRFAKPGI